jgi:hypothetical protein
VNPEEAKIVRELFELYIKEHSLLEVAKIANSKGYKTKVRKLADAKQRGGVKFSSTSIEKIIKNAYYIGKVRYQNELYPGEHERILDDELFLRVQNILHTHDARPKIRAPIGKKIGLLSKLLRCSACNSSMYLAHSVKHGTVRYNHYVCLNAQKRGYQECPTKLVNAGLMEAKIIDCLRKLTDDQRLESETWETSTLDQKREILREHVQEITYSGETEILEIKLTKAKTSNKFKVSKAELKYLPITPKDRLIRTEPQLRQNLLLAHQIQELIDKNKVKDIKEVSGWLNLSQQRMNQIMSLLFLSPRIQEEIITQNNKLLFEIPEYKLRTIIDELDWDKQYAMWQKLALKAT